MHCTASVQLVQVTSSADVGVSSNAAGIMCILSPPGITGKLRMLYDTYAVLTTLVWCHLRSTVYAGLQAALHFSTLVM